MKKFLLPFLLVGAALLVIAGSFSDNTFTHGLYQLSNINWTNFYSDSASGINWASIPNSVEGYVLQKSASGVNWTAMSGGSGGGITALTGPVTASGTGSVATSITNQAVQSAGVNWVDVNTIQSIYKTAMNWTDIYINTASAMNWQAPTTIPNWGLGKFLGVNSTTGVNWQSPEVTAGSTNTFTNKTITSGTNTFPTFNQNTTGTANIAGGTAGAIPYQSSANTTTVLAATATANKILVSGSSAAPTWSTPTFPNASATALKYIRSDGTNWIASTATISDTPSTAGKILISDATNWITSTPTFPNASATSGKYIKSDGTNWIASTGSASGTGACSANNWVSTLNSDAAGTCTQPAFTNLSGSASAAQMPAFTGDVTTSAGAVATTVIQMTSPKVITNLHDTNGNIWVAVTATGSAAEYLTVLNQASGSAPEIQSTGGDTNIDMKLTPKGTGGVVVTSTSTNPSSLATGMIGNNPTAQTIAAGNTITADSCGGIKRISSAGAVTTDTTNTFTAPAAGNSSCIMFVCNTGSNNITLDNNANFKSSGAADVVVTQDDCVEVGSTGGSGVWYQLTALEAN